MIQKERIRVLNEKAPVQGDFVLYWMQASPRAECNHALEYAIDRANALALPLVAFFGITPSYPEANLRHYAFLIEGIVETSRRMAGRGIPLVIRETYPPGGVAKLAADAALVVTDRGYLTIQKEWQGEVAREAPCPVVQVETNVVVPVETASPKEEWSAATFRRKIGQHLTRFLVPLRPRTLDHPSRGTGIESLPPDELAGLLPALPIDRSVPPVDTFRGGASEARRRLRHFLAERLDLFAERRNDPNAGALSNMSPYLHFGQISPLEVALSVQASGSRNAGAYLEELIVRRELAVNYVHYNPSYDAYEGLPEWARTTLGEHWGDRRDHLYSLEELEGEQTHDPYWNAAQHEMATTGKLHGYMRMYWGKKILEWTKNPEVAYYIALYLNNRYELDGRDPNGYAGVAWCFGKHDRPWRERKIFGKIRYMNARGLQRKFDADAYVDRVTGKG